MKSLLKLAIEAALNGGDRILSVYESRDFGVKIKSDKSPLTLADMQANAIIVEMLETTTIPIMSEEEKSLPFCVRKEWSKLWIVDPLDGTKEFIKRNGEFTVNIALVEDGVPILGVVYVPVKQHLYFATKENGSFKMNAKTDEIVDDEFISKAEKLPLTIKKEKFTVVASRSHLSPETEDYISALNTDVELISSGSSIKICLVAEGRADVYPRFAPTMEWDTAAGHAIALYAGKNVYHTNENTLLIYNKEDLLNPWFIVK